jgi:hypothetical protein
MATTVAYQSFSKDNSRPPRATLTFSAILRQLCPLCYPRCQEHAGRVASHALLAWQLTSLTEHVPRHHRRREASSNGTLR